MRTVCPYPLVPWLSVMMLGWVLGRWLIQPRSQSQRAGSLALLGVALLVVFAVVRGLDGYGNWDLHRDSLDVLQWLHVAKYPPSLSYSCLELELGLALLLLAGFTALDVPERPRRLLAPLSLFGATALFFYLLHVHVMASVQLAYGFDRTSEGLMKTWLAAALTVVALAGPCWLYRRYKQNHPEGWTRYI